MQEILDILQHYEGPVQEACLEQPQQQTPDLPSAKSKLDALGKPPNVPRTQPSSRPNKANIEDDSARNQHQQTSARRNIIDCNDFNKTGNDGRLRQSQTIHTMQMIESQT